jgi:hypothetical protein
MMLDAGCSMLDAGCSMLDARYSIRALPAAAFGVGWMRHTEPQTIPIEIPDSRFTIHDSRFTISDSHPVIIPSPVRDRLLDLFL